MPKNPKTTKQMGIKEIESIVEKEAVTWLRSNGSAKQIAKNVHDQLTKRRDMVMLKVLGFEESYGAWRVDHCNGRNSVVSQHISKCAKDATERWLEGQLCDDLPDLEAETVKEVTYDYIHCFRRYMRDEVTKLAQLHATEAAKKLVDRLIDDAVCEDETKETTEDEDAPPHSV
jgi:hypothetical protein